MFRLAEDVMIEGEYIESWAQSIHLSFATSTDYQQETLDRSDDDQEEIHFITNGLYDNILTLCVDVSKGTQRCF